MVRILVEVDVQRDFCEPEGALYVAGSPNDAFRALTRHALLRRIPIVGSVDSHSFDAWEFASNEHRGPNGEDPRFPDHCVKGTEGWLKLAATLPPRSRFVPNVPVLDLGPTLGELCDHVTQAVYFEKEVYSLFANPLAERFVAELGRRAGGEATFLVYGVATDYCVKAAALGLAERGHHAALVTDAAAGISRAGVVQALRELATAGVEMVALGDVLRS